MAYDKYIEDLSFKLLWSPLEKSASEQGYYDGICELLASKETGLLNFAKAWSNVGSPELEKDMLILVSSILT